MQVAIMSAERAALANNGDLSDDIGRGVVIVKCAEKIVREFKLGG
jgi:hypothetical protein